MGCGGCLHCRKLHRHAIRDIGGRGLAVTTLSALRVTRKEGAPTRISKCEESVNSLSIGTQALNRSFSTVKNS